MEKNNKEDWEVIILGDVFETVTGNTPPKKVKDNYGDEVPFIKPPGVNNNFIKESTEFLSAKGKKVARILPINSILITCIGNLGRVGINKIEVAFNQQINAIKPIKGIEPLFIYYQAQSSEIRSQLEKLSTSTTVALVNKSNFNTLKIKITSLPIQRAIVAKIEELFSSLDSGIADLTKAQKQLVVYRQAVLKKAFEGEYPTKKIIEIADVKTGATPKRGNKDYWENGTIPWVTSTVVNSDYVNEPSELITERAIKETNCKIIPKGSLLVAMYGEGKTRGKCSELNIDTATNQALAGIILFEENIESKRFVKWFFIKNYEEMRLLSSGGVQPNLNLSIIRNTAIPFPKLKEQHQIVREIESRLSVCDKVEESIAESFEKAKALRQSILKKAFEGKLLSEEEIAKCKREKDYEPAHILLERIRSEKKKKK